MNREAVVEIIVIGTSLGGLNALEAVLSGLSPELPVPVVIVQHRGKTTNGSLLTSLKEVSSLPIEEAEDKTPLNPGRIYLAPPDYHLLVERGSLALSVEPAVEHSRPSIDVLFESAANAYGPGVIGVILTGANADGAAGAARIRQRGGRVVVQDPAGAEAAAMPAAAIAAGCDLVVPLAEIASCLASMTADS